MSASVEPERSTETEGLTHAPAEAVPPLQADLAGTVLAVKEGETFLYSDTAGNLDDRRGWGDGLYHQGTPVPSHLGEQLPRGDPVRPSSPGAPAQISST